MRKPTVSIEELTISYGSNLAVEDVTLRFEGPGLVLILGPNGAGKTTLLKAILGLLSPVKGRVLVNGVDVSGRPDKAGRYVGYVPQLFLAGSRYPVTPWELVESSLLLYRRRWPRVFAGVKDRESIAGTLKLVGLHEDSWFKSLWSLSGGQRQRVLIARALVHNPPILVLDEPLSAVDPAGKVSLARFISKLSSAKLVIVTSHDPTLFLPYTKTVVLLNKRVYGAGRPEEVLTLENARLVYGDAAVLVREYVHISNGHIHA